MFVIYGLVAIGVMLAGVCLYAAITLSSNADRAMGLLRQNIFYLEVTNDCNAKCGFCPRTSQLVRKIGYMTDSTLERILPSINNPIQISGMGEPLMHPSIVRIVQSLSQRVRVQLNTNGILLSQDMYNLLSSVGLYRIVINEDYSGYYTHIVEGECKIKRITVQGAKLRSERIQRDNWAGRVKGFKRQFKGCDFLKDRKSVV